MSSTLRSWVSRTCSRPVRVEQYRSQEATNHDQGGSREQHDVTEHQRQSRGPDTGPRLHSLYSA